MTSIAQLTPLRACVAHHCWISLLPITPIKDQRYPGPYHRGGACLHEVWCLGPRELS